LYGRPLNPAQLFFVNNIFRHEPHFCSLHPSFFGNNLGSLTHAIPGKGSARIDSGREDLLAPRLAIALCALMCESRARSMGALDSLRAEWGKGKSLVSVSRERLRCEPWQNVSD